MVCPQVVNAEKTKYKLLSRHKNAGQNHNIKIGDRSFENVAQFKYLGMTVTNQNLIREEIHNLYCLPSIIRIIK
jgi:hypothetical protein